MVVSSVCIGRDRLEGKAPGNEEVNELRGQGAVLVVFKGIEGLPPPTGSRSKTEMNNLVSVVLQSSVDKGKWPEG